MRARLVLVASVLGGCAAEAERATPDAEAAYAARCVDAAPVSCAEAVARRGDDVLVDLPLASLESEVGCGLRVFWFLATPPEPPPACTPSGAECVLRICGEVGGAETIDRITGLPILTVFAVRIVEAD